ncbi:hypothetical protein SAMN05216359_105209 [Roseateles sp. YR242]|uniref:hypothetical protein n=1 Tax=Roseateles sp. YR242 TaxID=1855305 RepID=UPI0008B9CC3D|nr:hypothetical protein [Roseateles sp. YR242]SEL10755.1 hypothetical protein SAMN05216359_105209 [Roseateles sp. YR242]
MNPSSLIAPSHIPLQQSADDSTVTLTLDREAPVAGREGCFRGIFTALGRCLARDSERGAAHTARYQRAANTESPPTTDNPNEPVQMPHRPLTLEEGRAAFMELQPTQNQIRWFDSLVSPPPSAEGPGYRKKLQTDMARLIGFLEQSNQLQDTYINERMELLLTLQTLQQLRPVQQMEPYERTLISGIHQLINNSEEARTDCIGGNASALGFFQSASQFAEHLMLSQQLFSDENDELRQEIKNFTASMNLAHLEPGDRARIGNFLARTEGLRNLADVESGLQFISDCLQRNLHIFNAITAARVRERLCKQGVPPDQANQVAPLLNAANPTYIEDILTVANHLLEKKPVPLAALGESGLHIGVCRHSVTDYLCRLKGLKANMPGAIATTPLVFCDDKKVFRVLDENPPLLVVALTPVVSRPPTGAESVSTITTFEVPREFDEILPGAMRTAQKIAADRLHARRAAEAEAEAEAEAGAGAGAEAFVGQ